MHQRIRLLLSFLTQHERETLQRIRPSRRTVQGVNQAAGPFHSCTANQGLSQAGSLSMHTDTECLTPGLLSVLSPPLPPPPSQNQKSEVCLPRVRFRALSSVLAHDHSEHFQGIPHPDPKFRLLHLSHPFWGWSHERGLIPRRNAKCLNFPIAPLRPSPNICDPSS